MYLSKSSLNTWHQCGRKFQYLYIDKLERGITSPEARRGLEVHDFIHHFYDNLSFYNNHFKINADFYDSYMDTCLPDAQTQINNFIEFEQNRWNICKELCSKNPKKLFIPLCREEKFLSEKLQQITIIDRLDQRKDGNYTLVEIKTEKFQNKGWKNTEFRREMMFEKTTCETSENFQARFPNDIVDFVIYFPRSNDIMMEGFNWRTASALKKALERMRMDIDNSYYPCNVNYHCRFCNFTLTCPMEMSK